MKLKNLLIFAVLAVCFMLGMKSADAATITVKKVEKGTSTQIRGATMTLSKPKVGSALGDVIMTWTTDGTTKSITVEPGTYKLVENSPAPGYVTAADKEIVVTSSTQTVNVTSESDYTKIEISALDGKTNKHLSGVKFELYDSKGSKFATWTSNGTTHRINRVPLGTYTLKVISVPSGYKLAGNSTIVVDEMCAVVKATTIDIPTTTTPTPTATPKPTPKPTPTTPPKPTPTPTEEITEVPNTAKSISYVVLGIGMLTVIIGSGVTYKYGKQN